MRIPGWVLFLVRRGVILAATVVVAVYVTIYIANMGGYVDEIVKGEVLLRVSESVRANPAYRGLNETAIRSLIDQLYRNELDRLGFNQPFVVRSINYLWDALSLNLGRALFLSSDSGSRSVRIIIMERLPNTVLLFTTTQLILFFLGLFSGLYLSRRYGSRLDRVMSLLTPLSSLPGWFYGLFLILIFASVLRVLPYGGMVDIPSTHRPARVRLKRTAPHDTPRPLMADRILFHKQLHQKNLLPDIFKRGLCRGG
jgi:peptide/nickel transport system permease protein